MHGGHLFGRFCFPVRADTRWASRHLSRYYLRVELTMLTLTSLVSPLAWRRACKWRAELYPGLSFWSRMLLKTWSYMHVHYDYTSTAPQTRVLFAVVNVTLFLKRPRDGVRFRTQSEMKVGTLSLVAMQRWKSGVVCVMRMLLLLDWWFSRKQLQWRVLLLHTDGDTQQWLQHVCLFFSPLIHSLLLCQHTRSYWMFLSF